MRGEQRRDHPVRAGRSRALLPGRDAGAHIGRAGAQGAPRTAAAEPHREPDPAPAGRAGKGDGGRRGARGVPGRHHEEAQGQGREGVRGDRQGPGAHGGGGQEAASRVAHGPAGHPAEGRPAHLGHRAGDRPLPRREPGQARDRPDVLGPPHPVRAGPQQGRGGVDRGAQEGRGGLWPAPGRAGLRGHGPQVLGGLLGEGRRLARQHQEG